MTQSATTLVLRRVPPGRVELARALAPDASEDAGSTWWELVDVAAPPGRTASGVALTSTDGSGVVRVLAQLLAQDAEQDGDLLVVRF